MKTDQLLETCVYVDDLAAARHFYGSILGLEIRSEVRDRHVFFNHAHGVFLVFNPLQTRQGGKLPPHGATGSGHVAFGMELSAYPLWKAWLLEHGVPIECEYDWNPKGRSLYFRDPAGNSVELTTPGTWGLQGEPAPVK